MPDNWTFVAAAYGVAALVFAAYWRRLARRERELRTLSASRSAARVDNTMRSREPSMSGHPRSEPGTRPPLQS
jgi:Flp pilus assembly protein TadB